MTTDLVRSPNAGSTHTEGAAGTSITRSGETSAQAQADPAPSSDWRARASDACRPRRATAEPQTRIASKAATSTSTSVNPAAQRR